jgi:hypothetical protein
MAASGQPAETTHRFVTLVAPESVDGSSVQWACAAAAAAVVGSSIASLAVVPQDEILSHAVTLHPSCRCSTHLLQLHHHRIRIHFVGSIHVQLQELQQQQHQDFFSALSITGLSGRVCRGTSGTLVDAVPVPGDGGVSIPYHAVINVTVTFVISRVAGSAAAAATTTARSASAATMTALSATSSAYRTTAAAAAARIT